MTRIIGGFAGSLALTVPPKGTRPTSDRVREAIFSALEARDAINGATVLDLYAGSGALGLEAASRGAGHVVLVEKNYEAAAICRKNAETIQSVTHASVSAVIDVANQPVQGFLDSTARRIFLQTHIWFNLVFIDPPYDLGESELAHNLHSLTALINSPSIVVVERSSRSPEPIWPDGMRMNRYKKYGETILWWASTH
jgi:16S rRNA (guanine966-N2)-methyltransferase